MPISSRPSRGDSVWFEERFKRGKSPHGRVDSTVWEDGEVIEVEVYFHMDGESETIEGVYFDDNWNSRVNQWQLYVQGVRD